MAIFESWNVFEETGKVEDYLKYRTHTNENMIYKEESLDQVGDIEHGGTYSNNGDGIISHANW